MHKVQKTIWEALLDYDKVCMEWMHEVARLFPKMNKDIFIILTKCGVDTKWYALGQGILFDGALMGLEGASLVNVWGWCMFVLLPCCDGLLLFLFFDNELMLICALNFKN
jgi:hypothetical protein